MSGYTQPSVARREGQSYWDRLREIEAILAARDKTTDEQRARIRAWLEIDPRSAKRQARP